MVGYFTESGGRQRLRDCRQRRLAEWLQLPIVTVMKTVTTDDVSVSPQVMAWLRGGEEVVVLLPDCGQARLLPVISNGTPRSPAPADAATIRRRFSEVRAEYPARDLSGVVDENKGDW